MANELYKVVVEAPDERVLEDLMRHGAFRCKIDIPSCLLDE